MSEIKRLEKENKELIRLLNFLQTKRSEEIKTIKAILGNIKREMKENEI